MDSHSQVYLRQEKKHVRVANGLDKPDIPAVIRNKWQKLLDQLSEIFEMPASLIMMMTESDMKVFLSSHGENNPYEPGAQDSLGHGLYCETVIGRNEMLEIEDATADPDWKDNPDVKLDMVSYLGFPIHWPDGAYFGTICSLDSKSRAYQPVFKNLMETFRQIIELDLDRECEMSTVKNDNASLDQSLREIHHQIKNQFYMISGYLQIKQTMGIESVDALFRDIEHRIRAIGLIHEKIYKSGSLDPDTSSYISELANIVIADMSNSSVALEIDIAEIPLGKRLLNLGTVIVELITNSLKYAFRDTQQPKISITLERHGDQVVFLYADNGSGFAGEMQEGLGMSLLRTFGASVRGNLKVDGNGNFSVALVFPFETITS